MKPFILFFVTMCLCSSADAQLTFTQEFINTRVVGDSETKVWENWSLKSEDDAYSLIPASGFNHTQGLVSSDNATSYSHWTNADGTHEAKVTHATGWVLSSTITGNVYNAFIQAAGKQVLFCKSPGNAPEVTQCDAISRSAAYIMRGYTVTDPNKGSAQLVKATLSLKSVYSQTGLYSDHANAILYGSVDDNSIVAIANSSGWTIIRQLRTSSGAWENPTPPHFITYTVGKNFDVSHTCYSLVEGTFTTGAYKDFDPDGTVTSNKVDATSIINGVSGQNPNVTESFEPSIRVNIIEVTRAF